MDDLLDRALTPEQSVDCTLRARRTLLRHAARLDALLHHSHGYASTKVAAIADRARELLPAGTPPSVVDHLLAPHEHLVSGLVETHEQVRALAQEASDTANLVASTAVGRLLDRSEANRTASTAVGAAAFSVALLSCFTAIASIPAENRDLHRLIRLAGWIGAGGLVVGFGAVGLAKLAARRPPRLVRLTPLAQMALLAVLVVGALTAFLLGATTGVLAWLVTGAVLAGACLLCVAVLNDFR